MKLKEELVRREGIGADLVPMLVLHYDGVILGHVALVGERNETLGAIATLTAATGADLVLYVTETFLGHWPDGDAPAGAELASGYGLVASRFAAGDPHVREAVMVTVGTPRYLAALSVPYRYAGRSVEWDKPSRIEDIEDGAVPAAFRNGFEGQDGRRVPLALAAGALGLDVLVPFTSRPPRNEPCPCGSGLKAKRCCWR